MCVERERLCCMTDFHTRPFFSEATRDCFGCQMGQAWKRQDFLFQPERSQALLCSHRKPTITFLLSIQSIFLHLKKNYELYVLRCKNQGRTPTNCKNPHVGTKPGDEESHTRIQHSLEFGRANSLSTIFIPSVLLQMLPKRMVWTARLQLEVCFMLDFRNSSLQSLFLQHFFSYRGMKKMKPALKLSASASPNWLLQ